jgi:LuxR family maltose regulon positive regulatory protein
MQIILDKITTPGEQPRISRPRLLNTLHGSLANCTSTIINGRAGTGKTYLASDFARRSGRRVAWYKVDASDTDLQIFFRYLVASVRQWRPAFGQRALMQLVETATLDDIPMLAEAFVYELLDGKDEPLLIVIDDLHLVYDAEWVVPFFRRLLPLLPVEAHMLITGRSLPPAPLWRMRSKQTLCVIEEPTLLFTQLETTRLFSNYGLSEAQATSALRETHGRASSLDATAKFLAEPANTIAKESFSLITQKLKKRPLRQRQGYGF